MSQGGKSKSIWKKYEKPRVEAKKEEREALLPNQQEDRSHRDQPTRMGTFLEEREDPVGE